MSEICNTALALSPEEQRDKKRLAQTAGLALLSAVSDVYRALEMYEREEDTEATKVYVLSAVQRLRQMSELLGEVRALLSTKPVSPELAAWYERFDFERLYEEGVRSGAVPANRELWTEVVSPIVTGGPVAACDAHLARVEATIALAQEWLTAPESPARLAQLESAVLALNVCARFGAYINKVEPLDPQWLRLDEAVGTAR